MIGSDNERPMKTIELLPEHLQVEIPVLARDGYQCLIPWTCNMLFDLNYLKVQRFSGDLNVYILQGEPVKLNSREFNSVDR